MRRVLELTSRRALITVQTLLASIVLALALPASAALNIFATTPEWGALATELGGDKVKVYTATNALQDAHRVEAKPSLVARARSADLLIATGAELEIGWLPVLQRECGNNKIQAGTPGYFEAAAFVPKIEVPQTVDRSMGDVHPQGNPHIQTDPRNIAKVADALAQRLSEIDGANKATYEARNKSFQERWKEAIGRWESAAASLKNLPVVVAHKDYSYLNKWLGLREVDALEPKPGLPPTAGHLAELLAKLEKEPAKIIVRSAYSDAKSADWLATRAKIPVVVLPFTVGGDDQAKDLFSLFDDTINRLLAAVK
jgi:zinc/manganese transport system substrate-binding protein